MEDRFNFRFFDKENKTMRYDLVVKTQGKLFNSLFDNAEENNMVIMQSTGLKDKNGKLIYEGDIVKVDQEKYADGVADDFINKTAVISYMQETGYYIFAFEPKDNSGDNIQPLVCDFWHFVDRLPNGEMAYCTLEYLEIIGNIYETPELLEQ